jgi:hypothetical protein
MLLIIRHLEKDHYRCLGWNCGLFWQNNHFPDRVQIIWPAYSPNFNTFDFFLIGGGRLHCYKNAKSLIFDQLHPDSNDRH